MLVLRLARHALLVNALVVVVTATMGQRTTVSIVRKDTTRIGTTQVRAADALMGIIHTQAGATVQTARWAITRTQAGPTVRHATPAFINLNTARPAATSAKEAESTKTKLVNLAVKTAAMVTTQAMPTIRQDGVTETGDV